MTAFRGLAIDASGAVYVTGRTSSMNFPTRNPAQAANRGGFDAFVTKLDASGAALVYSTYLGGGGDEWGYAITVDAGGSAHVTGQTASADFPTTGGVLSTVLRGTTDAFVTRLDPGGALVFSTLLGGGRDEIGRDVVVDTAGNVHVTGLTSSADFPTLSPVQASSGGASDAFVAKLNAAGTALVFSTYLGGSGADSGLSVATDATGRVFAAGVTQSANFPVLNAAQAAFGGAPSDVFVAGIALEGPAILPPTVQVTLNGSEFRAGQTLTIGVDARNPSGNAAADLYLGAVLPDGQTLVFLSDRGTVAGTGSLSAPATFARALAAGPGPAFTASTFFQFTFPSSGLLPGTYRFFAVLARQGAFADNRIDPGDLLVLDAKAFTFTP